MKNFLFFYLLFISEVIFSQCPPGDLNLTTQSDLDSFKNLYPNCSEINGNLTIDGYNDNTDAIQNLQNLENITLVKGNLNIQNLKESINLEALNNLSEVQGEFYFYRNSHINIDTFNNLELIGDSFRLIDNDNLVEITGFVKLESIQGNFNILANQKFEKFNSAINLKTITGDVVFGLNKSSQFIGLNNLVTIGGSFRLDTNSFNDFIGFDKLKNIGGQFYINSKGSSESIDLSGFVNLESISGNGFYILSTVNFDSGFENLKMVNGSFRIDSSQKIPIFNSLETINGNFNLDSGVRTSEVFNSFNSLKYGVNDMFIDGNSYTKNITGFKELEEVNSLEIEGGGLQTISGFNKLKSIKEDLLIRELWDLRLINGFSNLEYVGGDVIFRGPFYREINISGFTNIQVIEGELAILEAQSLNNLDGFNKLTTLGQLNISTWDTFEGAEVKSLNGFNSLTAVPKSIAIQGYSIENFSGFSSLKEVGTLYIFQSDINGFSGFRNLEEVLYDLELYENTIIPDLNSLSKINSIGRYLTIRGNSFISNLNFLYNLEEAGTIQISSNFSLSSCNSPIICYFLDEKESKITITSNSNGCNSKEEVIASCNSLNLDDPVINNFRLFPNPVDNVLYIQYKAKRPKEIHLFNNSGKKIKIIEKVDKIDFKYLSSGVYFIKFIYPDFVSFKRVIRT